MRGSTLVAGVADAETGQPLEGAEVLLVELHRLARANALGEATIAGIPPGTHRIRVRRLGYVPADLDLPIAGDTAGAVFRLQHAATHLATVDIEAQSYWIPPKMKDVEVRKKQGIGRFLDEPQLAKEADREFSLVAAFRFPGLRAVPDSSGHFVLASTREQLRFTSKGPSIHTCYIAVYLDDILLQREDQDLIRTWDLATVEYYTGVQVPVRYRTGDYGCGVLLAWSKWY